jgi:hypothetical protein
MIPFQIRLRADGMWVPDHADCADMATHASDTSLSVEDIRASLWQAVDSNMPGVYTLDWDVPTLLGIRLREVDARTRSLIYAGFTFEGKHVSASLEAQSRHNALRSQGASAVVPAVFPTIDNTDELVLDTASDLSAFLDAAQAHPRVLTESGAELKAQLRAATTVAELQAFVDPR